MGAKSYTQWSIFKNCGARYKYQYVERLPTPPRNESADRGVDIHAVVERIVKGEEYVLTRNLEDYEDFFKSLREKGAIAEYAFVLNDRWENHMDGEPEERWIRGYIDIIVPPKEEGKEAYIYELKTGKVYDDHVDQRFFYATVALSLFSASEVTVVGVYLDQGENHINKYERSKLMTYKYMWNNRLKQLDMPEAMIPNPGFHCRWCPFSKDKGGPCKFSGD